MGRGARLAIDRFPEAKHQSFATLELAEEWYWQNTRTPRSNHSPVYHFETEAIGNLPIVDAQQATLDGVISKRFLVYLIIDPDTEEPFYVGETGDFERRQRAHLRTANHNTKRASAKIAQILDAGLAPVFKTVEFCESKSAALAAETRWVRHCVETFTNYH